MTPERPNTCSVSQVLRGPHHNPHLDERTPGRTKDRDGQYHYRDDGPDIWTL